MGATAVVATIWDQLGLGGFFTGRGGVGFDLAGAVFAMVLNWLTDPSSKRRVIDWLEDDQALPEGFGRPELWHLYRALDHLAAAKDELEVHLWSQLTDLANMDLGLVCYDLTSTYFERAVVPSKVFASKAFGYSRDKRSDGAQIVIGLLCVGDGMPIAHRVWAGNTSDVATLPTVLEDLRGRFPVGRICVVADRGLISAANLDAVQGAGFAHIIATRLH
ncbi:MAG: IS1634 family transposase, partial [Acidimicrobiia bacterium]|nr:IS1634 family transposase [Acidimicrobiia bacterium]